MIKRTQSSRPPHILPFQEWVEKKYPEKTPSRTLLRMIGALDLAYLVYRLQAKPETSVSAAEPVPAPKKSEPVKPIKEKKVEPVQKKIVKKKEAPAKKAPKAQKVSRAPAQEITLEFHARHEEPEPEPIIEKKQEVQLPAPEPEPLELEQTAPEIRAETKPEPAGDLVWFDDERLEEQDLRRTKISMGIDGIPVSFRTRDIDDERETLLRVNGVSYIATLSSPSLNLSQMLQIARVDYGELYVLGRMALGAISGEGYITAEEAARIVRALNTAGRNPIDMEIEYYTKDKTARSRTSEAMRIRFEPI